MKKVPFIFHLVLILSFFLLPHESSHALSTRREMPDLLGVDWIGPGTPYNRKKLEGQVVLIQFWNLNCADCLRTIPYLKKWSDKYASDNLEVIGVHTPFEEFEKDKNTLKQFIKNKFIYYPVAIDNESRLRNTFNVPEWPTLFLIDAKGRIRHVFKRHGNYDNIELHIQDLITEKGGNVSGLEIKNQPVRMNPDNPKTENIYLGYKRINRFGNNNNLFPGQVQDFSIPELVLPETLYLSGKWEMHDNYARLAKGSGELLIRYRGNGVNILMGSKNRSAIDTFITLNGHALTTDLAGKNVVFQPPSSLTLTQDYKLYQIVDTDDNYDEKELRVRFSMAGVDVYRLEFGNVEKYKKKSEVEKIRDSLPLEQVSIGSSLA